MNGTIIQTQGLTRDFKKVRAVDSLDLAIDRGELFGLIGPDGAGKTTTLRLLAGLLTPTEGTAVVAGHDLAKEAEAVKPKIGYMAQRFSLYGEMTVIENLHFFAEIYNVPPADIEPRTERLLRFAGLTEFTDRRAANLSGGMQKKLALACTLIHEPEILLLDEPTMGVDPVSRREFWHILTDLHARGTTIIVTTPYMDEADRCSRIGFMYAGRLIVNAPPAEIRGQLGSEIIELVPEDWRAARAVLADFPGLVELQTYGETLHLLVDSAEKRLPEVTAVLDAAQLSYRSVRVVPPRMEQAFMSLIQSMNHDA
jgi:ABC-2 type transport system ATP-binding protein